MWRCCHLYFSNYLLCQKLHSYTLFNDDTESALWVKTSPLGKTLPSATNGRVYQVPQVDEETTFDYLTKTLTDLCVKYPSHSVVMGCIRAPLQHSWLQYPRAYLSNAQHSALPRPSNLYLNIVFTNNWSYVNKAIVCHPWLYRSCLCFGG